MLGISGGDPAFRGDDGSAPPEVITALTEFAAGRGSEQSALAALASSRLLVPVVAVLADEPELRAAELGEKASEMAMPTLIGFDGRRAVPAFTSLESMSCWQSGARPVPVAALAVWQAAGADSAAVVIDVAGPVPFAIEGARLAALARGEQAPEPYRDPDVHEIVAGILARQLYVAAFDLQPGEDGQDLAIVLSVTNDASAEVVARIGAEIAEAVQARLGGRFRRGIGIWLGGS